MKITFDNGLVFVIIIFFQMILSLILTRFYIFRISEKEKIKKEMNILKMTIETANKVNDNIYTLNHDLTNILHAINGYIAFEDLTGLQKFVYSVTNDCTNNNSFLCLDKKLIDEPALYGVIISKYFLCVENNIKFDILVTTKLSYINFSVYKLTKLLGILLDNAIEAALMNDDRKVELIIEENFKNYCVKITIINTYDILAVIELDKIFKNGFSTKKGNTGKGLWEVNKIISSSRNIKLNTSIENNLFVQELEIFFNY